jgi:hypothetical protein
MGNWHVTDRNLLPRHRPEAPTDRGSGPTLNGQMEPSTGDHLFEQVYCSTKNQGPMLISTCEVIAESVPHMFADSGLIEILGTEAQAEVLRENASDYAGLYTWRRYETIKGTCLVFQVGLTRLDTDLMPRSGWLS